MYFDSRKGQSIYGIRTRMMKVTNAIARASCVVARCKFVWDVQSMYHELVGQMCAWMWVLLISVYHVQFNLDCLCEQMSCQEPSVFFLHQAPLEASHHPAFRVVVLAVKHESMRSGGKSPALFILAGAPFFALLPPSFPLTSNFKIQYDHTITLRFFISHLQLHSSNYLICSAKDH